VEQLSNEGDVFPHSPLLVTPTGKRGPGRARSKRARCFALDLRSLDQELLLKPRENRNERSARDLQSLSAPRSPPLCRREDRVLSFLLEWEA
jgi:hypothetical protein